MLRLKQIRRLLRVEIKPTSVSQDNLARAMNVETPWMNALANYSTSASISLSLPLKQYPNLLCEFLEMMCRIWNRTAHYIATKKPLSFSISLNTSHEICSIDKGKNSCHHYAEFKELGKAKCLGRGKVWSPISFTNFQHFWLLLRLLKVYILVFFSMSNYFIFFYNSSPLVWWIWRHINLALLSVKIRIDAILLILLIETMCITVTWR